MHTGNGQVVELILEDGCRYARVSCPETLIPAPGQYLLASDDSSSPLPVPIFHTESVPGGFIATSSGGWMPGQVLFLRGPLGRGFSVPPSARRIALIAFDNAPARLRGLIRPALKQTASLVLVSDSAGDGLPDDVEIQPISAMDEIIKWADYIALEVSRERFSELMEKLAERRPLAAVRDAQILIHTQMPCGGVAECGVCAVVTKSTWKLACKDGPVFDLREI